MVRLAMMNKMNIDLDKNGTVGNDEEDEQFLCHDELDKQSLLTNLSGTPVETLIFYDSVNTSLVN